MGKWMDEFKRQLFGKEKKGKRGRANQVHYHLTAPAKYVYHVYIPGEKKKK